MGTTPFSSLKVPSAKAAYQETPDSAPAASRAERRRGKYSWNSGPPTSAISIGMIRWWMKTPSIVSVATIATFAQSFGWRGDRAGRRVDCEEAEPARPEEREADRDRLGDELEGAHDLGGHRPSAHPAQDPEIQHGDAAEADGETDEVDRDQQAAKADVGQAGGHRQDRHGGGGCGRHGVDGAPEAAEAIVPGKRRGARGEEQLRGRRGGARGVIGGRRTCRPFCPGHGKGSVKAPAIGACTGCAGAGSSRTVARPRKDDP